MSDHVLLPAFNASCEYRTACNASLGPVLAVRRPIGKCAMTDAERYVSD